MMLRADTPAEEIDLLQGGLDELRASVEDLEGTIERLAKAKEPIPHQLLTDRDRQRKDLFEMEKRLYELQLAKRMGDI